MQRFLARLFITAYEKLELDCTDPSCYPYSIGFPWYPRVGGKILYQWLYPFISKVQRFLFGWIPFSIGDLFYGFILVVFIVKLVRMFKAIFQKKINRFVFCGRAFKQIIFFFLFVYVFFNLLWGLNYNRNGIARQLGLNMKSIQWQNWIRSQLFFKGD